MTLAIPKLVLYQGNKELVRLFGLNDKITGDFVNNAILNLTVVDDEGTPVTGATSVAVNFVASSNGNYVSDPFGGVAFQPPVGTGYTTLVDDVPAADVHLEIITEIRARNTLR